MVRHHHRGSVSVFEKKKCGQPRRLRWTRHVSHPQLSMLTAHSDRVGKACDRKRRKRRQRRRRPRADKQLQFHIGQRPTRKDVPRTWANAKERAREHRDPKEHVNSKGRRECKVMIDRDRPRNPVLSDHRPLNSMTVKVLSACDRAK